MNAAEVIKAVGDGVLAALQTNELFLGIEALATRNPDIHPEYITTVKVAEQLTGLDRDVGLEVSMAALRRDAAGLARLRSHKTAKTAWPAIDATLSQKKYQFGKKRLDIVVRDAAAERPPFLMVEAKLGVKQVAGVIRDIGRLVTLFDLYADLGVLDGAEVYGAVVFHAMKEKGTSATLPTYANTLLTGVNADLVKRGRQRPHLHFKAGLLTQTLVQQPVSGYQEDYEDGTFEKVFEKHGFAFQAGMVLIGNAADIHTTQF